MTEHFSMAVIGGGLAGLTAALVFGESLRQRGEKLAFVAPERKKGQKNRDGRTTAILMPGIALYWELGIWDKVEDHAAPLKTMRLVDGSARLIRAPVTDFRAGELGLDAFGYNVPNEQMITLLEAAIGENPAIRRFGSLMETAHCTQTGVVMRLEDKTDITADFAIAADGRNSALRQAVGIGVRNWSYPQTALVLNFSHTLPHDDTSTEFHCETGPFTHVPLPATDNSTQRSSPFRSSLVWVVTADEAEDLLKQSTETLSVQIETKMQSGLGKVTVENRPQSFPLAGMIARSFARGRVALVGEAAHVIPPIGAQGFNLGLRDIVELKNSFHRDKSLNYDELSIIYNDNRKLDITLSSSAVDMMNRSLLTDFLPVQALRASGIAALRNLPLLRKQAMQNGMGYRALLPQPAEIFYRLRERGHAATNRSR